MGEAHEKRCKETRACKVEEIWEWFSWDGTWTNDVYEYEVRYDNGFKFRISIDPAVLEVKIGPYTKAEYEKYADLIQSEIYDTAKELRLRVPKDAAAHVTAGAKQAFGGNLLNFRNYVALAANHPEADLVLNTSIDNSPPFSLLPESSKRNLVKIIDEVDDGEITDEVELSDAIVKRVQNKTYNPDFVNEYDPAKKYQAKNLQNMRKKNPAKRRFENRAMPPANSADDVLALITLVDADIEYAVKKRGRVPVDIPPADLTKAQVLQRYKSWLRERGLNWKHYEHLFEPLIVIFPPHFLPRILVPIGRRVHEEFEWPFR